MESPSVMSELSAYIYNLPVSYTPHNGIISVLEPFLEQEMFCLETLFFFSFLTDW